MTSAAEHATLAVGDELPVFELAVTSTRIIAGAIASRDFMPVHHDPEYARAQGAPDIFMNILTTNGYLARYVSDWAGPRGRLRNIKVRLGAPAVPGQPLLFAGRVSEIIEEDDGRVVEIEVSARNEMGDHAAGTVSVALPR